MVLKNMVITGPFDQSLVRLGEASALHPVVSRPDFWARVARAKGRVPVAALPLVKVPAFVVGGLDATAFGSTGGH